MRNNIVLHSINLPLKELFKLVDNSYFKNYKNTLYEEKNENITTFYLIQKNNNKLFYLDDKNNLKYITYNNKPTFLTSNNAIVLDVIKNENINQIILNKSFEDTNSIFDIREKILFPILQLYFDIRKPNFFNNKIIWETIDEKQLELEKIFKDQNLSKEEKLEKMSNLLLDDKLDIELK